MKRIPNYRKINDDIKNIKNNGFYRSKIKIKIIIQKKIEFENEINRFRERKTR